MPERFGEQQPDETPEQKFTELDFSRNPKQPKIEASAGTGFKSPEERKVTDRTFKQCLEHFCLPERELVGKKILDIGSGLSDFPAETNERFKESGTVAVGLDPIYQSLGNNFEEFKENVKKANMGWNSIAGRGSGHAYGRTKTASFKVAGSHQELPFGDESFDLVVANNSITQYKDREVTKKALKEAVRVIKENGEIRIQPADLRWDPQAGSLYVHTFEAPTSETREEAKNLGLIIGPDKEVFQILKEIEKMGLNFYAISRMPRRRPGVSIRMAILKGPSYSLILRKDDKLPEVEGGRLRKLSFEGSADGFHVHSVEVSLDPKNKN
jgi:ubiquinone/menaquinone biosynthesis C-methylase UbiE